MNENMGSIYVFPSKLFLTRGQFCGRLLMFSAHSIGIKFFNRFLPVNLPDKFGGLRPYVYAGFNALIRNLLTD